MAYTTVKDSCYLAYDDFGFPKVSERNNEKYVDRNYDLTQMCVHSFIPLFLLSDCIRMSWVFEENQRVSEIGHEANDRLREEAESE